MSFNPQSGACISTERLDLPAGTVQTLVGNPDANYCVIQFIDIEANSTPVVCVTEGATFPTNDYGGTEGFLLNNLSTYECENRASMNNVKMIAFDGINKIHARILYYK
jgi:hypothetical protein